MSIQILLCGCNGKMGEVLQDLIKEKNNMKIVAGLDTRASGLEDFPTYKNFNEITEDIDIIIDFSNRVILNDLINYAIKNNVATVLATTGYIKEDEDLILKASAKIPIFRSQNMSYGINVVCKILEKAVKLLEDDFDIEIVESHHNLKKDSPSGTAKLLLNVIKEELSEEPYVNYGREGGDTKRKDNEIGIHAIRGGTISGEHTIVFAGIDENLEIKHTALSKKIFANGAIKAGEFLANCKPGYYNMNDIIN